MDENTEILKTEESNEKMHHNSLIFCMLLALASCGKTDTSSPENSISIDTENMEESEEAEYSESEQSEYTESEEEFITVDRSTIKNATGYHNGYNYVTFNDGTSAVFDMDGIEVARSPLPWNTNIPTGSMMTCWWWQEKVSILRFITTNSHSQYFRRHHL